MTQSGIEIEELKNALRETFAKELPERAVSFEPADIVNEVMSFGSPTPVEVAVSGPDFAESRELTPKSLCTELAAIPSLRDLQYGQSLDYPTSRSRCRPRKGRHGRANTGRRLPVRSLRRRRRAGSSSRTSGPTPRAASPIRCRSKFRGRSFARPTRSTRSVLPTISVAFR